ncbi:unnamed protein product [Anisakis simplex]|uniref:C-type lectin domain-containing protein n=1 Tax=Anisakis simplex TaxID=6269 RepID=A0A0M3KAP1_ANISI|nr:unnamed protein product [Anisakis simplex]
MLRQIAVSISLATLLVAIESARNCPIGSFSSPISETKCFNFTIPKANFFLASESCREVPNASLAVISNIFENAALRAYAMNYDDEPNVWIGLNDVAENGDWNWINGERTEFTKWAPGYPKSEPNALCVALNTKTGFWENKDCADRLPFFCSRDGLQTMDSYGLENHGHYTEPVKRSLLPLIGPA